MGYRSLSYKRRPQLRHRHGVERHYNDDHCDDCGLDGHTKYFCNLGSYNFDPNTYIGGKYDVFYDIAADDELRLDDFGYDEYGHEYHYHYDADNVDIRGDDYYGVRLYCAANDDDVNGFTNYLKFLGVDYLVYNNDDDVYVDDDDSKHNDNH